MMSERLPSPEHEPTTIAGRSPEDWHCTLTGDDLVVPCSRYGRSASEVAWWAVALLAIYEASGAVAEDAEAISDFAMGLAVNDNADVALMIWEHWSDVPRQLQDQLGGRGRVEDLLND